MGSSVVITQYDVYSIAGQAPQLAHTLFPADVHICLKRATFRLHASQLVSCISHYVGIAHGAAVH